MSFGDYGNGGYGGGGGFKKQQPTRGYQGGDGDDAYLQCSQKVTSNIFAINQNVQQLDNCTKLIGGRNDTPEMRQNMSRLQEKTRQIIRDTGTSLKRLGQFDGGSAAEARQRRLEQDKLSRDFKSSLQKFQKSSQIAVEKEREYVGRARTASRAAQQGYDGSGGAGLGGYDEKASLIEAEQRRDMEQVDEQIDYSSSLIEEREQSIKEIESTMTEVNEIYRDLSTLVVEQGNTLDNIEANMDYVDKKVESGTETLGVATRYQKKARGKMCCILMIVVCVLAALVIIIVTQTQGDKKKN